MRRSPGRPREPVSREALLAAAREEFAQRGFAAASLSAIAERVGLRKASLFHHFESKEALYLEALASAVSDLATLFLAARSAEGDFPGRLDQLTQLVSAYLGARPPVARLLLRELVDAGPFLQGPGGPLARAALDTAARFLEDGMDAGAFARQDPRQLLLSVLGLHLTWYAGAALTAEVLGGDPFAEEAVSQRSAAVCRQVRALCGVPAGQ